MRISLDWLAEFIDFPSDEALVERLTLAGFDDVEIFQSGPDLSGFCVGQVIEHAAHPQADRLSVCRVETGSGDPVEVVCGAPNVARDQKIAFAPVGSVLPDGTPIKRAVIRGLPSMGMICSRRELGLGGEHEGILVLDSAARVGAALSEVVSAGSKELELTITPNRGDAASLIGLAREVRALFGGELRVPPTDPVEVGEAAGAAVRVAIDAPDDCHRYVARVVRGVRVAASPDWLVEKLAASGIRSINNIVDVTNLVLLELGQPLHAFDLSLIRGEKIAVRRAAAGEKLVTLDGETRALDPQDLVIADAERAIALAGVMGGADTEVGSGTTDILIESAQFHPTRVRLAARRHALRSEASYRFERGVDRCGVQRAADRAARLIAEHAGGEVARGAVSAEGTPAKMTEQIRFPVERANKLLGTSLSADEIRALLDRVGVSCEPRSGGEFVCSIPSHRNDLHLHQDLIEEVARIYGYERIPVTEPIGALRGVELPRSWRLSERARDALSAAGLAECQTLPFLNPAWIDALRLDPSDPRRRAVRISNPVKDEEPLLRTTLLPSLLRVVHQNRARQAGRIDIFELGRRFLPDPREATTALPAERLGVVAALCEREERHLWEPPPAARLFFRAKGVAKKLLNQLGYVAWFPGDAIPTYLHPGAAARIEVEGTEVGAVGELHPDVAGGFELGIACAVIELDLATLGGLPERRAAFRDVSRLPSVRRDLAVLLDENQPAGKVLEAIRKTAGKDLISVELFDRYAGEGVPEGRVSLAFRLVFQRSDRTLTDEEVTKTIDRVVRMLAHRFNGELR